MKLIVPLVGAFASGLFPGLVAASLVYYALLPGIGTFEVSAFASAAFFGKIAASAVGGSLSDWLGRTVAIRLAAGLSLLGVVVALMFSGMFPIVVLGLGLEGFALGLFSVLLPLHIVETLPVERRGRASAGYQFFNTAGAIAGAGFGYVVATLPLEPAAAWRIDLAALLPVSVVFLLLAQNMPTGGTRVSVKTETGCLLNSIRPFLSAVIVLVLTSAMGAGVVIGYAVWLLQSAGFEGAKANAVTVAIGLCSMLAALVSARATGRCGRQWVLCIGGTGAALSLVVLAVAVRYGWSWIVAGALLSYLTFFVFGPGVSAWIIAGELLPPDVRAKGMSWALLANQVVTAILSSVFLPLAARIGTEPFFAFFALAAVAYGVLVGRFRVTG